MLINIQTTWNMIPTHIISEIEMGVKILPDHRIQNEFQCGVFAHDQ